ncbi:uncharacterized protein [Hemitrygon akajei]|uniref:uncharacterized protein n=1 Tax=Hemitrygon akajei TaxID=2704970 RepID=UPI003BF96BF1
MDDSSNLSPSSYDDTYSRPLTKYSGTWDLANISSSTPANFQTPTRYSAPLPRRMKPVALPPRRSHTDYLTYPLSSGANTSRKDFDLSSSSNTCNQTISYDDDYLGDYLKDVSYGDDSVFLPNTAMDDSSNLSPSSYDDTYSRPLTKYSGTWDLANISSSTPANFQTPTRYSAPLPRRMKPVALPPRRSHTDYLTYPLSSGANTSRKDFDLSSSSNTCNQTISYDDDYLGDYLKDVSYGDDSVFLPNNATYDPSNLSSSSYDETYSRPLTRYSGTWDLANISSSTPANFQTPTRYSAPLPRRMKPMALPPRRSHTDYLTYPLSSSANTSRKDSSNLSPSSYDDTCSRPLTRYSGTWDLANISSSTPANFQTPTRYSAPLPRRMKPVALPPRRSHTDYLTYPLSSSANTSRKDFDLSSSSNTCNLPNLNSTLIEATADRTGHLQQDFGELSSIFSADSLDDIHLSEEFTYNAAALTLPDFTPPSDMDVESPERPAHEFVFPPPVAPPHAPASARRQKALTARSPRRAGTAKYAISRSMAKRNVKAGGPSSVRPRTPAPPQKIPTSRKTVRPGTPASPLQASASTPTTCGLPQARNFKPTTPLSASKLQLMPCAPCRKQKIDINQKPPWR